MRRLQKPTLSRILASGKVQVEYDDEIEEYQERMRQIRPKSSKEQAKVLERLQKPTKASKRHVAINEGIADNNVDVEFLKKRYCENEKEKFLTKVEEKELVSRILVRTYAFYGNEQRCPKIGDDEEPLSFHQRKQYGLPLLSGLPRSHNANEITARVCTHSEPAKRRTDVQIASNKSGFRKATHTPAATTISVH